MRRAASRSRHRCLRSGKRCRADRDAVRQPGGDGGRGDPATNPLDGVVPLSGRDKTRPAWVDRLQRPGLPGRRSGSGRCSAAPPGRPARTGARGGGPRGGGPRGGGPRPPPGAAGSTPAASTRRDARVIEEFFLDRVAVEPGDGAQPPGDGGPGAAAGFQVAGEELDVGADENPTVRRPRPSHQVTARASRMCARCQAPLPSADSARLRGRLDTGDDCAQMYQLCAFVRPRPRQSRAGRRPPAGPRRCRQAGG
jgi:hypothetical protein